MSGERRRARRLEAGDLNGGGPGRGRSGPNGGEGTSTEAGRTLTVNEPHGLDVGGRAPEFGASLVRSDGTVAEVTLSECLGDGPVLLTFCALDAVPRDPEGWCALHDVGWFASDENLQVVGVSRADTRTHCRFIERFDLGYPLVSDRGGEVADRYGVCYRDPRSQRAPSGRVSSLTRIERSGTGGLANTDPSTRVRPRWARCTGQSAGR